MDIMVGAYACLDEYAFEQQYPRWRAWKM
jgi:hypothetical protein